MTGSSAVNDEQARATSQSLVELAAGVLGTDATSVWHYDDERAYLLARYPQTSVPQQLVFAQMPEVGASILAGETELYQRSEAPDTVREWMELAGIQVSLRLPVAAREVQQHFLGLSWNSPDHPPIGSLLPMAQRFADHLALGLRQISAGQARVESALELSDNVAQALVVAKSSLQLGRHDIAENAIDRALEEFQAIMQRLVRDDRTGELRRLHPSDVLGQRLD